MSVKKIEITRKPGRSNLGPDIRQMIPSAVTQIDPFVFLDHYGPFQKQPGWEGVPGHPHAGIITVTYILEGTNRHEDSLGNDDKMSKGGLAVMIAGKGIIHAEGRFTDATAPETSHGVQFWLSLPAKDKFMEPDFTSYTDAELPEITHNGIYAKVLIGQLWGETSPVKTNSPTFMYEVKIPNGETTSIPVADGDNAGLYVVSGDALVNGENLAPTTITRFERAGDVLEISATTDAHIFVFGGTPLDEPIASYASFVMNDEAQLKTVIESFNAGKMGKIT